MRIFAAAALFIASALIGICKKTELEERAERINVLLKDMRKFSEIIELMPTAVTETAKRLDSLVWKKLCDGLEQKRDLKEAWEDAAISSGIKDQDCILHDIGVMLTITDPGAQLRGAKLIICDLEREKDTAQNNCRIKGKLFAAVGILMGSALAILVI